MNVEKVSRGIGVVVLVALAALVVSLIAWGIIGIWQAIL